MDLARRAQSVPALAAVVVASIVNLAGTARAEAPATNLTASARSVRVDVEVDPLAYALSGHSVHVGVGASHFRFDLGAFALEMPTWVHGNEGFTSSFDGFGVKAHVFLEADGTGPFAGIAAGLARTLVQNDATGRARRELHASAGLEIGWLIPIIEGLYVKPWVGLGWTFGLEDIELDGERFEAQGLTIFPTVHLGYVF